MGEADLYHRHPLTSTIGFAFSKPTLSTRPTLPIASTAIVSGLVKLVPPLTYRGRVMAISGQVNGSVCLVQLMQPV